MRAFRFLWIGVLVSGLLLSAPERGLAAEKKFPTKSIQTIVPFPPGETDNLLRPFIEKMPEYLGQPLVFVYKPGAASALGGALVASSKPDGYTLIAASQSPIILQPLVNKEVKYSLESFAPISCLVAGFFSVTVQANSRWKTIQDLVAEAKKSPGKISYATAGTFALPHIAGEALCQEEGIKLTHIPAQGAGPSVAALLGGHIDFAIAGSAATLPHIKAGTLRSLMTFNERRARSLPNVPSAGEFKYPAVPLTYGLLAPKGTPDEIINILAQAAKKALESQGNAIENRVSAMGAEILFLGPQEYSAFLKHQNKYFAKVINELKN